MTYRVIFYHKQATSARTLFLKFKEDSICAPEPLPKLSQMVAYHSDSLMHPSSVLSKMEGLLGFKEGTLKAEGEYLQTVEAPGEAIQIILANINTLDPPFDVAKLIDAQFIDLTQARGLPQVELELLRFAYQLVLGG
ncbi:MAG: hypothetical protein KZQ64_02000 [gamma proteobacterium symbiont of Bathyaustriella thionipta]|nr:hypothetical protein [gamma proteobacterium symbiont of Bathyaustriella thionipta]MCU7950227.1 hypothetical protein [gamma proteobacterium symbiont of Bathyaustriella thionipta]MCU7952163.1 hypothetical protein [gamma proteobacterium symbiont of Bathyaustriella thionipta]MCU7956762.1 hypothetical protein [gamma proteobacterium symbiont of Bathyaustriella thionipta]MCU7968892.1 hypothetical protein [gamma proteobacterium symbiont of Bathyaustriella thionipta]